MIRAAESLNFSMMIFFSLFSLKTFLVVLTLAAWYWGKGVCVRVTEDRIWGVHNFELQGKDPEKIQLKL